MIERLTSHGIEGNSPKCTAMAAKARLSVTLNEKQPNAKWRANSQGARCPPERGTTVGTLANNTTPPYHAITAASSDAEWVQSSVHVARAKHTNATRPARVESIAITTQQWPATATAQTNTAAHTQTSWVVCAANVASAMAAPTPDVHFRKLVISVSNTHTILKKPIVMAVLMMLMTPPTHRHQRPLLNLIQKLAVELNLRRDLNAEAVWEPEIGEPKLERSHEHRNLPTASATLAHQPLILR